MGTMARGKRMRIVAGGATAALAATAIWAGAFGGLATGESPAPAAHANAVVTTTADAPTVHAGRAAAFTIVAESNDADAARGVTLTVALPAGVAWSARGADCAIAGETMTCALGDLASGEIRSIRLTGATDASDCGALSATATVTAANQPRAAEVDDVSSADVVVACR